MIILTTDIDKFKSEFPDIYALTIHVKQDDVQHEIMLNDRFKNNLCEALIHRYGIFACSHRWLLTNEVLKSYLSCVIDYGNPKEYDIQDYKNYFSKTSGLKERVFSTREELCDYMQNNQVEVTSSLTMRKFGMSNLLKILRCTGGYKMSNIEESIRIAMKELGIDVDNGVEDIVDVDEPEEDTAVHKEILSDPVDQPNDEEAVVEPDSPTEDNSKTTPAVYAKIKDGIIALIFNSSTRFQCKELGGQMMNVLSFQMPDITSEKLQELVLISENETQPEAKSVKTEVKTNKPEVKEEKEKIVNRTPIVNKDENKKTDVADTQPNSVLIELKNQKCDLDLQIKEARSNGDVELVNSLRKQRRAIRNKINSIGG